MEDSCHIILLYPKLHCEINWIEYSWDGCKHFARKHSNYALDGKLRLGLRIGREHNANFQRRQQDCRRLSLTLLIIHKYWERTQRIIQAYRGGVIFGMYTTGKRCIEATAVFKLPLGIDYPAHETFN